MSRSRLLRISPTGLLVSVRSASEARAAVAGGASVIDVKEPDRGPLGCADPETWEAVRRAVPPSIPVSVALGDLRDWVDRPAPPRSSFRGVAFRKLGFAGSSGDDWHGAWVRLRRSWGAGPSWVAAAYLDAEDAGAPSIAEVRDAVLDDPGCEGMLLDTWRKGRPAPFGPIDADWLAPLRDRGLLVALAGGLDAAAIARLSPIAPDLFGVRGAACRGVDRSGTIDPDRVRELRRAVDDAVLRAARRDAAPTLAG